MKHFDSTSAATKLHCRSIAPKSWEYAGWWDGFYHFQLIYVPGTPNGAMRALEVDLTAENLALMAEDGVSR